MATKHCLDQKIAKNLRGSIEYYERNKPEGVNDLYQILNINKKNISFFDSIRTIPNFEVHDENCFDLYKMSLFFDNKLIHGIVLSFCSEKYNDITRILTKIHSLLEDHLNIYDKYFYSFLQECQFITKLSSQISFLFQDKLFRQLPIFVIIKVLEQVQKNQIPFEQLYNFILESVKSRFLLIRFIDFNSCENFKIKKDEFNQLLSSLIGEYDICIHKIIESNNIQAQTMNILKDIQKENEVANYFYIKYSNISNNSNKNNDNYQNSFNNNNNNLPLQSRISTENSFQSLNQEYSNIPNKHSQNKSKTNDSFKNIKLSNNTNEKQTTQTNPFQSKNPSNSRQINKSSSSKKVVNQPNIHDDGSEEEEEDSNENEPVESIKIFKQPIRVKSGNPMNINKTSKNSQNKSKRYSFDEDEKNIKKKKKSQKTKKNKQHDEDYDTEEDAEDFDYDFDKVSCNPATKSKRIYLTCNQQNNIEAASFVEEEEEEFEENNNV